MLLKNVKMSTITNCWRLNIFEQDKFMLSWVEHKKGFITLGPGSAATELLVAYDRI